MLTLAVQLAVFGMLGAVMGVVCHRLYRQAGKHLERALALAGTMDNQYAQFRAEWDAVGALDVALQRLQSTLFLEGWEAVMASGRVQEAIIGSEAAAANLELIRRGLESDTPAGRSRSG